MVKSILLFILLIFIPNSMLDFYFIHNHSAHDLLKFDNTYVSGLFLGIIIELNIVSYLLFKKEQYYAVVGYKDDDTKLNSVHGLITYSIFSLLIFMSSVDYNIGIRGKFYSHWPLNLLIGLFIYIAVELYGNYFILDVNKCRVNKNEDDIFADIIIYIFIVTLIVFILPMIIAYFVNSYF